MNALINSHAKFVVNEYSKACNDRVGGVIGDDVVSRAKQCMRNALRLPGWVSSGLATAKGYVRARRFFTLLDNMYMAPGQRMKRSAQQISFHNEMNGAALPLFFDREEWKHHSFKAPRVFELQGSAREIAISAPRQYGKTTSVSAWVAAIAAVVPGLRIAVFSRVSSQSDNLLARCVSFLQGIPWAAGRWKRRIGDKQILFFHDQKKTEANTSIIQAYSSDSRNARGLSAHILIVEEAAYVDKGLFEKAIVPLLGVNKTCLIMISTPSEESRNYFNTIMQSDIFRTVTILANVCIDCSRDLGLKECFHSSMQKPSWKNDPRMKLVHKLLKGSQLTFEREALGMICTQSKFAFNSLLLDRVKKLPLLDLKRCSVPYIIVAIDPTGGGASELAICSMIPTPDRFKEGDNEHCFTVRYGTVHDNNNNNNK